MPLHVASEAYSPLLHGFKANTAYDQLVDHVFAHGTFGKSADMLPPHNSHITPHLAALFTRLADDPACVELADKLWRMTGFAKLDPSIPVHKV